MLYSLLCLVIKKRFVNPRYFKDAINKYNTWQKHVEGQEPPQPPAKLSDEAWARMDMRRRTEYEVSIQRARECLQKYINLAVMLKKVCELLFLSLNRDCCTFVFPSKSKHPWFGVQNCAKLLNIWTDTGPPDRNDKRGGSFFSPTLNQYSVFHVHKISPRLLSNLSKDFSKTQKVGLLCCPLKTMKKLILRSNFEEFL